MTASIKIGTLAIVMGLTAIAQQCRAAEDLSALFPAEISRDSGYYEQPTYRPDTRAIIHEKARANAEQRRARLASMSWYGMSNSRPTASPTPFATRYSPVWEMPGHRPFAWHAGVWPSGMIIR